MRKHAWLGGIAGPAAFVAAWSILGTRKTGYSPIHDPISRLAAVDAGTRIPMTAGFAAFGVGVALYATALRHHLPGGAAAAATTTAAATIGVGLLPLGASFGDAPHAAAAGLAYASLAATPLLGARALHDQGHTRAAQASVVAGTAIAASLAGSILSPTHVGLFQRTGLTIGDVWIVATALAISRRQAATTSRDRLTSGGR